METAKTSVKPS